MSLRSALLLSSLLASEAWQPSSSLAGVRGRRLLHAGLSDDVTRAKDYLMGQTSALTTSAAAAPAASATHKQSFLEATPYSNQANVPVNTFKAKVGFKVVINNSLPLRLYLKEGVDRGSARGA